MQEQYSLNAATWTKIYGPLTAVSDSHNTEWIDFSGIADVSNDPNFGVRLVSAYDTRRRLAR